MNRNSLQGNRTMGPTTGVGGGSGRVTRFDTAALFRQDFAALFGDGLLSEDGYQPFLNSDTYHLSGGANYVRSDSYAGGVLTGPAGTGSANVWNTNGTPGTSGQAYIGNPRNQPWAVGGLCAVASAPDATTNIYFASLLGANDDVSLLIQGSHSTTVLEIQVNGATSGGGNIVPVPCNSVGTIGSGIVIDANNFLRYIIGFDPNTGLCLAGVNGVLAASATPGLDMPTQFMCPFLGCSTNPTPIPNIHRIQGMWWGYGL